MEENRGGRELKEVSRAFNSMTQKLEGVEEGRREFVSNVSHELRSPITSIRGFAEGHDLREEDLEFIVEFQTLELVAVITEWIAGGMRDEYRKKLNRLFHLQAGTMDVMIGNLEKSDPGEGK